MRVRVLRARRGGTRVTQPTADQLAALEVARGLARAGVPLFLARPDPAHPSGWRRPAAWQLTEPDPAVADAWRPGLALCMVTGRGLDVVDSDGYKGHDALPEECLPRYHGLAATPSGGVHYFVAPVGERSRDGAWPGVDVKAGDAAGEGRGFVFLPPTERASRVDGAARAYRWVVPPRVPPGPDGTAGLLVGRLRELRAARPAADRPRRLPRSAAAREWAAAVDRLAADLRAWAAAGWGGEAHAGLLAASTHLARLSPEHAADAYLAAFAAAGVEPDEDDLRKLETALDHAVPDEVVDDAEMTAQELFLAGGDVPEAMLGEAAPPGEPGAGGAAVSGDAARAPFHFYTEEELLAIPEPARLVDGLLWSSTVARLYGPSTVGKTWVALDLAAHVALGLPWQGRATRRRAVVYVAAEGAPSVGPRLRTWREHHGRRTEVLVWPEAVPVSGEGWPGLCAALEAAGAGLVVLDTQAASLVGLNENSNSEMQGALRHLGRLARACDACVLLVHHVGHEELGRARGAYAMFGGLDTELALREARGGGVLLAQEKQKYAELGRPAALRLERSCGGLVVAARDDAAERERDLAAGDEVRGHVAALQTNNVDPGRSLRALVSYLRDDLGRRGGDERMRDAVRLFKAQAGVSGVVVPPYLRGPEALAG